ncbi:MULTISPECIES: hypothetical protein [unclassified Knoellia]|uniref:hypothetical protein n=1 Tax=Knoellia altitudinis TaxID=3404795 RepID=UPI003621F266
MTGEWWGGILAFIGAAIGSGATFYAARRDTLAQSDAAARDLTQRERAGAREEWGRRFTAALADINAQDSFRRRELGRVVLVELATSDLATTEERDLADSVLVADARLDLERDEVALGRPGMVVDDVDVVEDDGDAASERSRS